MRKHKGFTLVEILVVLAIITLLMAVLFPVFKRVQENGYQAHCASNLQQIYTAVNLYYQDEKRYPGSLAFLLPRDAELYSATPSPTAVPNTDGTGHLRAGKDTLLCADDTNSQDLPRSSYGDISTNLNAGPTTDIARYVWNYYGYKDDGTAYKTPAEVADAATKPDWDANRLFDPTQPYDPANPTRNPINNSMSNRFAPQNSTIITHCVYHRVPTSDISAPEKLYDASEASYAKGAKDIVLFLDGRTKNTEVWAFKDKKSWIKQNF